MPRVPIAEWRAEQFRLTVFPLPSAGTRSPDWWEAITDSQPDETKVNPKKSSGLITGAFGPGTLILRLEPERIDWLLAPREPDMSELAAAPEFPTLGTMIETLDEFSAIAERWLARDDLPEVGRIAFGAILVHPEADRAAGYQRLPDYLPVQVDPASSDFLYQINLPLLPSSSGIDNLRLNRLSKWTVAAFKFLAFRYTGTAVEMQPVPEAFALRVELDVNTAPDFKGAIPRNRVVDVYRELVAAGRAIATNGVIAQ